MKYEVFEDTNVPINNRKLKVAKPNAEHVPKQIKKLKAIFYTVL